MHPRLAYILKIEFLIYRLLQGQEAAAAAAPNGVNAAAALPPSAAALRGPGRHQQEQTASSCIGEAARPGPGRQPQPEGAAKPQQKAPQRGPQQVFLSKWLARPNRVVDPAESWWLFCEVLLLVQRHVQKSGLSGRLTLLHRAPSISRVCVPCVAELNVHARPHALSGCSRKKY